MRERDTEVPEALASRILATRKERILTVREEPVNSGTGAASSSVVRFRMEIGDGETSSREVSVIRKVLRPLAEGRHAAGAAAPRHWAYWRREAEAYGSGLLPTGPGLRAPTGLLIDGAALYLEEIRGEHPSPEQAARHLAVWQLPFDPGLDRPWLARGQLEQRLQVSQLDWTGLDVESRLVELWGRRWELSDRLGRLPMVRSHGDYSIGNLVARGSDTVALDWATIGWEPLGFDLAHLALSTGIDPRPFYRAAALVEPSDDLDVGFTAALAIVGASRVHWMLTNGHPVPIWYVPFLWAHLAK